MKIADVIQILELWAPPSFQESYDNARLICGDDQTEVTAAIVTLDCTEEVVQEAINKKANLIIAHHPIVFSGLKSLTGANYVERTVIEAIKNDIAIYAIHTNLDNVHNGVNFKIGQKLGLADCSILAPKENLLLKLCTYVPATHAEMLLNALFEAGAGHIGNYDHCSFASAGVGTFRGNDKTHPYAGEPGQDTSESETKLEVILPRHLRSKVVGALLAAHPYEEVAYDLFALENSANQIGSGMVGMLPEPMSASLFLNHLSESLELQVIKHTADINKPINRVAFCGGAGRFLLNRAMGANADVFITSDIKYHEFFDHEKKIMIIDVGHFESERFTPQLIAEYLADKNVTFAVLLSEVNTNPVHYFIR